MKGLVALPHMYFTMIVVLGQTMLTHGSGISPLLRLHAPIGMLVHTTIQARLTTSCK